MNRKITRTLIPAILLSMLCLPLTAWADNYFSLGVNDTLRVPEACLGGQMKVNLHAHFDGWVESWNLTMSIPEGSLTVTDAQPGPDMKVPYTNSLGMTAIYLAPLSFNAANLTLASSITEFGYWDADDDGHYDIYGLAKWAEGYHHGMVVLTLDIPEQFTGCSMSINGRLFSTTDWRGVRIVNGFIYRNVQIVVGRMTADVDGDGKVSIADVTDMIDLVLNGGEAPDGVGDIDGDGVRGISDVTMLVDMLLGR